MCTVSTVPSLPAVTLTASVLLNARSWWRDEEVLESRLKGGLGVSASIQQSAPV